MAILSVRGRVITCNAKPNQIWHYMRLYEGMTDEQLDYIQDRPINADSVAQDVGDRLNPFIDDEYEIDINSEWHSGE